MALVVVNVTSNRLLPSELYVPWALASSAALVWFAVRVDGRTWSDLGLSAEQVRRGLFWGSVLVAAMFVVYVVGVSIPATRDLFRDDRVADLTGWEVVYYATVRVPLGTVALEELAFRAVLPAMLVARTRWWKAMALSAVAFGLWHVLPAMGMDTVNPVAEDTIGQLPVWVTVAGAVASTTVAGFWFLFLRYSTRSVVTPMMAHWASNSLGYLFAFHVINS